MKKWIVRDREAGNVIDWFDTEDEAIAEVERYEERDREEDNFEPDFYEIVFEEPPKWC